MEMDNKNIIYIVIVLIQVAVVLYLVNRRFSKKKVTIHPPVTDPDSYTGVRDLALSVTPSQLKLLIPDTQNLVYGVVMDCNLGNGIVTLAAYITGAANIYFSHGERKTGGGKNPEVGEAAVEFVTTAQHYINRAIQAPAQLPPDNCVRFHLLTNHGIYVAQEQLMHITNGASPWISLFEKGNEVLNRIKLIS